MIHRFRFLLAFMAIALVSISFGPFSEEASAQTVAAPDRLELPQAAPTLRSDAWAGRDNPAAFARGDGLDARVAMVRRLSGEAPDGVGFHSSLALFGVMGFGLSTEWIDTRSTRYHITDFGFAIGAPEFQIGFGHSWYGSRIDPEIADFSTARIGVSFVPYNNFGFSILAEHLGRPRIAGAALDRLYTLSLGVSTTREALALEAWWSTLERGGRTSQVGAHLRVRPAESLRLSLGVELGEPAAGLGVTESTRVLGGLEILQPFSSFSAWASSGQGSDASAGVGVALTTSTEAVPPARRRNLMLVVRLSGVQNESPSNPLFGQRSPAFVDTLHRLWSACETRGVDGVLLNLNGANLGSAQAWELADMLTWLRESCGKHTVAWLNSEDVRALYVASHAEYVLAPTHMALFTPGIAAGGVYFGDLLARLGVAPQFVFFESYKTAPESFMRDGPSDEEREQVGAWLDTVWSEIRGAIMANRDVGEEELDATLARGVLSATMLKEAGLIDGIASSYDAIEQVDEHFSRSFNFVTELPIEIGEDRYLVGRQRVAIVHIDGLIAESGGLLAGRVTGPRAIRSALREIAKDPLIVGVIVRVSSGGGSAAASWEIRELFRRGRAELPPMIMNFGDIAASGGYYVAATGAPIIVSPTTLTGSIGIYAGSADFSELLSRIGVSRYREERGGPTGLFSGMQWTEAQREGVRAVMEEAYELFLSVVAEGRGMTVDEVREVAGGRIWSGTDAAERGLADDVGGFRAGLERVTSTVVGTRVRSELEFVHYPDPRRVNLIGDVLLGAARGTIEASRQESLGLTAVIHDWLERSGHAEAISDAMLLYGAHGGEALAHFPWADIADARPASTALTPGERDAF